jgi:cytochrome c556
LKKLSATLAFAAATCVSAPALAQQFGKPEDAVKYRQAAMYVMQIHATQLGRMANGRIPYDAKAAAESADVLAMAAKLPWAGFGPGTDKISKHARPEIWTEQAKFKEHADKLQVESQKLAAAAKTNSVDSLKAAFGPVAQTCKACHDAYQKD